MTDNTALFRALIKIAEKSTAERKHENGHLGNETATASRHQQRPNTTAAKRPPSSPHFRLYNSHARQILVDVTELRDLVLDKRKEYILCSNAFSLYGAQRFMSDEDRKKFDRETDMAIRQCTKLIKDLELQIESDRTLRANDERKHLTTVVNLLNIYLKEVLSIVAQLRQIHVRKTRQIRKICRLANLVDMYELKLAEVQREEDVKTEKLTQMKQQLEKKHRKVKLEKEKRPTEEYKQNSSLPPILLPKEEAFDVETSADGWDEAVDVPALLEEPELVGQGHHYPDVFGGEGWADAELDISLESSVIEPKPRPSMQKSRKRPSMGPVDEQQQQTDSSIYEPTNKAEQSQLVAENRKLFDRFASLDTELQRIESHVAEIQRLQNVFAEKISEQEENIDIIHSRTVYTLDNLEQANDYIREAIKNQANRRVILIFCLLVLTFTLLFLHWYNP